MNSQPDRTIIVWQEPAACGTHPTSIKIPGLFQRSASKPKQKGPCLSFEHYIYPLHIYRDMSHTPIESQICQPASKRHLSNAWFYAFEDAVRPAANQHQNPRTKPALIIKTKTKTALLVF